jgi:flagellar motor component MotA
MKGSASLRLLGLILAAGVFVLIGQDLSWLHTSYIDVKAALLVFVMPWLVLMIFRKDRISFRLLFSRMKETREVSNDQLVTEMLGLTDQIARGGIRGDLIKLADSHGDSYMRYAAGLFNSKFETEELSSLLSQRMQREDEAWQGLNLVFGFLAKMAPYFGMLATVIGMIHLLENMQDFNNISSSMALALQGTLYGLVSFTMVFSPIQKWVSGFREATFKRNSMVAQWFLLLSAQRDPALIRANLEVESVSLRKE